MDVQAAARSVDQGDVKTNTLVTTISSTISAADRDRWLRGVVVSLSPDGPAGGAAGEAAGGAGSPDLDDSTGWPELDLLHDGEQVAVPFDVDEADRHFTMVLDRGVAMVDGRPTYAHTVNG